MKFTFQHDFSKESKNFLDSVDKAISFKILKKIHFFMVQDNPLEYSKKLKGKENLFRFRVGEFRVIFSIRKNGDICILYILKIAHRKDVYEN